MELHAFGRHRDVRSPCQHELTLSEMLSDPIVKAVMEADGVDSKVLEAQLRSIARSQIRSRLKAAASHSNPSHRIEA